MNNQRQEHLAFQQQMPNNHCFGCGTLNEQGLGIKSYWVEGKEGEESVCEFMPQAHHNAGPEHVLNGGIISTIIDCHCVCTAFAKAYAMDGRPIGDTQNGDFLWFATGTLEVRFNRPVAIDQPVILRAKIIQAKPKKITLECTLESEGEICNEAKLIAVKVPKEFLG
ncbi:PaaI family thioesterase [Kangiella sp. TOML190]|uniref:PaaI family thioesterase n=1 Tax=Kangiella sp. TOML190 TaxID=2931351 RepID=UPI00204042F6|nr:PaaI family thioesterase [Kangiella sp. TOML190]